MLKEIELSEQAEQLENIIEMLAEIVVKMREAFVHHQSGSTEKIDNLHLELNEEIAFDAAMADEQAFGKPLDYKEPILLFEKILAYLQGIDKSLRQLADALQNQMKDGVLFTGKEMEQINLLMGRQERIFHAISEVVRNGDEERLKEAGNECRELADSCLKFASSCESRPGEGLCTPETAPVLFTILNRIQELVHKETETVRLLARWIWDRATVDQRENLAGHPTY